MAGESCREAAAAFGVSIASAVKWSQRFRATGSAAARPMGGKRPRTLENESDWLLDQLAKKPDTTLRALVAELRERGVITSYGSVWRAVHRARFSFKKKHCSQPNRIVPTSPEDAPAGKPIRADLILLASSSSTRPGPKPT
jgi:transposase